MSDWNTSPKRYLYWSTLALWVACGTVPLAAQSAVPRTAWGDPDLQGIWMNVVATPLERSEALGDRAILTDTELAELAAKIADQQIDRPPAKGSAGYYNRFWIPAGQVSQQTSLIVDPPNGRLPPFTSEGQRRADALSMPRVLLGADGPEDRDLWERCLTKGLPRLPGGYNNNLQIFQARGYVVILIEMVHEARIIPLDGRPHIGSRIRQLLGDSRGHWEHDTLIVETANFTNKTNFKGSRQNLHLAERFTRRDVDTLDYEFTVTDPTTFTRPWTARVPITKTTEPLFEYACHEGNYALANILRGARREEEAAEGRSR